MRRWERRRNENRRWAHTERAQCHTRIKTTNRTAECIWLEFGDWLALNAIARRMTHCCAIEYIWIYVFAIRIVSLSHKVFERNRDRRVFYEQQYNRCLMTSLFIFAVIDTMSLAVEMGVAWKYTFNLFNWIRRSGKFMWTVRFSSTSEKHSSQCVNVSGDSVSHVTASLRSY